MSSTHPRATLADYVVVGISPTLIAFLVGSLVFFLVEVLYQGAFEFRLNFILALFVMATVCVARISMEEGHAYAATFAAPLALVTGIAMMRFVQISGPLSGLSTLINWGMLALIWWCSHKLTWDCTLLDDSTDASGQGLLERVGLDTVEEEGTTSAEPPATQAATVSWWQAWLTPDKRPHTPGVWVVWFSLAALPIFGIGQGFLPAGDLASRRYVFKLMVVYVGCGLGLLLTTSFLSIRKYLRQRRLEMPLEMAAAWLGVGVALIAGLLLFSFLLPRPNPEYSVAQLPVRWTSPDRGTSRHAVGKDGQKQGPTPQGVKPGQQPGEQQAQQGQNQPGQSQQGQSQQGQSQQGQSQQGQSQQGQSQQGQSQQGQSQQGQSQQGQSQQGQSQQGQSQQGQSQQGQSQADKSNEGKQGEGKQGDEKQQAGKQSAAQSPAQQSSSPSPPPTTPSSAPPPPPPPPAPSPLPSLMNLLGSLGGLLQVLSYFVFGLLIAYFAWKYRTELLEAWRKLLAELRELWAKLFGGAPPSETTSAPEAPPPPPRPFAAFTDPFASGAARQMTLAQLVRYTFEALEAWARERNCPRHTGQTPHEFAQYLGQLAPVLAGEVAQLADWYGQVAYARHNPPPQAANVLQQLWRRLTAA